MLHSQERGVSLGALEQYMRAVNWTPRLTSEEEVHLFERLEAGVEAQQARDRLVEGYQPLLIGLAKRFVRHCQRMELLDLVQEGNLGFLQALKNYDTRKGEASFRTFAFAWMRGAMLAAFWQQEAAMRLPLQKVRAIRQMNAVNTRLLALLEREPTIAETAQEMGLKEWDVRELVVLQEQEVVSLHLALDEDGEMSLADTIADPAASVFVDEGFASVEDVLEHLTERERVVITLRYGFQDGQPYTQQEVADLLGVPLSTVQMVDRRAKMRLRKALVA